MSLNFKEIPQSNGGFFKPEESSSAVAILVEVRRFERQVPSGYGPKDTAYIDMTIFNTDDALNGGNPSEEKKGVAVQQTILARDLADLVGAATIVTLGQTNPTKPGQKPAWVWRQTSQTVKDKVVAYANAREAKVQEALASAPAFD